MDSIVRNFLKASLIWLSVGVTLGVAMAVHPVWTIYRPVHEHMNLLGFVSMMIYGVAYHVIPRFSGHALWRRALAVWHWWIANAGLALMAAGFALRVRPSVAMNHRRSGPWRRRNIVGGRRIPVRLQRLAHDRRRCRDHGERRAARARWPIGSGIPRQKNKHLRTWRRRVAGRSKSPGIRNFMTVERGRRRPNLTTFEM
jgi:hypothetical protein